MGGKAKRRREKNYLAAHGGGSARLPPPPDASTIDVVPSKLRKIMSFTGGKESIYGGKKKSINVEKERQVSADEVEGKSDKIKKNDDEMLMTEDPDNVYDDVQHKDTEEKKKKKRKRNQVKDLRFEESDKLVGTGSKRKERRKLRNEERKKKRKGNREDLDSLNHDIVRFGDVVKAPPKLSVVPTTTKGNQDASKERLRLKAIKEYREKKGWMSRPGSFSLLHAVREPWWSVNETDLNEKDLKISPWWLMTARQRKKLR